MSNMGIIEVSVAKLQHGDVPNMINVENVLLTLGPCVGFIYMEGSDRKHGRQIAKQFVLGEQ